MRFYHPDSQRNFPARCVDISRGGMLMYVPAATPIKPGQSIRLTISKVKHPELAELAGRSVDASIARVHRHAVVKTGHLAVGVQFVGLGGG